MKSNNCNPVEIGIKDISNEKWLTYGRPLMPIVLSSSYNLGKEFIRFLEKQ